MNNFYKGGRGLAFSQREEGTCSRKEKPPRLSETLTNQVREGGADLPSAMARQVVGISSELLRVLFDTCSTGLRQLFGKSSAASRRAAEALPKDSRSCPEAVSNASRSGLEDHPNSAAESDKFLHRRPHISPVGFKYALSTDEVLFMQPLRKPKKSRLMYPECTASVRRMYGISSTEVRRSYRIPTTGLHAFCTPAVSRPARICERMVRFSLRRLFFKEPNDIFMPAALSLICFSLKSLFFKATKNKVVFSYGLLWFSSILSSLMFLKNIRILSVGFLCFMLFSLPMAWAQSAETRAAERQTTVNALTVGEKVPTDFWTQEHLFYVDGDTVRATLEEYKGKVLLLDFWATWCGTCIASMPRIHALQDSFAQDMAVLPVTQQSAVIVSKFIAGNSNLSQIDLHSIVGDSVLKKIFPHKMIPHVVWIVDEKVYAISNSVDVT